MIVTTGKTVIKNFFGGQVHRIGGSIALGTGTTAAALSQTALVTEVTRFNVDSVSPDLINNRIVFKGTLQPGLITTIYEIGLFYSPIGGEDEDVMIARVVLGTPKTVDTVLPTEIEYSLGITV